MKRSICIILAVLVMMFSCAVFSCSAEETTNPDYIYFQVPTETSIAWKNFSIVFCHIWSEGNDGGDFNPWQSKEERCTDLGNGYWSYDISALDFSADKTYAVIFSNENGMQTYNLTLTSACKGDIVYCDGDTCVNPVDSAKQCTVARWMENSDTVHPCAQVSSDGAIVDPDGIFNEDVDRSFGDSDGVSIAMPKVEVPTEQETEETQSETEESQANSDNSGSVPYVIYIIIGAVVVAIVVVVVSLVLKKKKANKE